MVMHLAVNTSNITEWAESNNIEILEAAKQYVEKVDTLVDYQLKKKIPILTIKILHRAPGLREELTKYFQKLAMDDRVHKNKTRVFIIGNWYDLDPELVTALKEVMAKTKDYDDNFLNFCIVYDGQDEIVSSVKVIATQIRTGKISPDEVDAEAVKEHMSSSYFPPPDLIIETSRVYSGLLLWDAKESLIHFAGKLWMDTTEEDFERAFKKFEEKD